MATRTARISGLRTGSAGPVGPVASHLETRSGRGTGYTEPAPGGRAGFTLLETAVASSLALLLLYGAVMATQSFTQASAASSRELDALSRNGRALQAYGRELMNATILDPANDLQILTDQGTRVPDTESGQPIPASGPVFKLVKNAHYRLDRGKVLYDRESITFRRDTAQDLNQDGRTDQFLRVLEVTGSAPQYQVLASNVLSVLFCKHGAVVEITCRTRGGVKGYIMVKGERVPEFTEVTQTLKVRPRNF